MRNQLKNILLSNEYDSIELKVQNYLKKYNEYVKIIEEYKENNFELINYISKDKNINIIKYFNNKKDIITEIKELLKIYLINPLNPNEQSIKYTKKLFLKQRKKITKNNKTIKNQLNLLLNNNRFNYKYDSIMREEKDINYNNQNLYSVSIDQISYGLLEKLKTIKSIKTIIIDIKPSFESNKQNIFVYLDKNKRKIERDTDLKESILYIENIEDKYETNMIKTLLSNIYQRIDQLPLLNVLFKFELNKNITLYEKILIIDLLEQEGIKVSDNIHNFYPITPFDLLCFYTI